MIISAYPIDSKAQHTIAPFLTEAPVNVVGMASALGVNVWEDRLGVGISGKLFRDDRGNGGPSGFSIVVNTSDPLVRKRFTIAHEIAHFLLHRGQIGPAGIVDDTYYRSGLNNAMETQANRLAGELLMPSPLIERLMVRGTTSVEGLAGALKVSVPAMKIRIGIPIVE